MDDEEEVEVEVVESPLEPGPLVAVADDGDGVANLSEVVAFVMEQERWLVVALMYSMKVGSVNLPLLIAA